MDASEFFRYLFFTVAGAIVGALASIASFRAKFVVIDLRFKQERERSATLRAHDKEMLETTLATMRKEIRRARLASRRMEDRQRVSLELMADIARKLGVDHRGIGVDVLSRTITDKDDTSQ